jgi:hypothetical protein
MWPTIRSGEWVTCEPVEHTSVRRGDILLVRDRDNLVAHRFIGLERRGGLGLVLRGDARGTSDAPVMPSQILGRIVFVERGGRKLRAVGPRAHLQARLMIGVGRFKACLRCLWTRPGLRRSPNDGMKRMFETPDPSDPSHECAPMLALCKALCLVSAPETSILGQALLDVCGDDQLRELVKRNGLGPALYRLPDVDTAGWAEARAEWRKLYLAQVIRNVVALEQLQEIAVAFAQFGVEFLVLKGAAALLLVYDDVGCRHLVDIDLLIPENRVREAHKAMEMLGYQRVCISRSAEDDWLNMQVSHLDPYKKAGRLLVEIHVHPMQGRPYSEHAIGAMWQQAVRAELGGVCVRCLSPIHFLLYTASHYLRHLRWEGLSSLKALVDVALLVQKQRGAIDWRAFWRTARQWDLERDVALVVTTLNEHLATAIPDVPLGTVPLSARTVVHGGKDREALPESVRFQNLAHQRFLKLPGLAARLRWGGRYFFPRVAYLRHYYSVPKEKSVAVYSLLRVLIATAQLVPRALGVAKEGLTRRLIR